MGPLPRPFARRAFAFAEELLELPEGLPDGHALSDLYRTACGQKEFPEFYAEFVTVALAGLHLKAGADLPGFSDVVSRIIQDREGWAAHLFEATIACMFRAAGWQSEFFVSDEESIPDIRAFRGGTSAIVECQHSVSLSPREEENRRIWLPAASAARQILEQAPSGMMRVFMERHAEEEDSERIQQIAAELVQHWQDNADDSGRWACSRLTLGADEELETSALITSDVDPIRDYLMQEDGLGLPAPNELEPYALRARWTGGPGTLRCEAIWAATVHQARADGELQEKVLRRLDRKTSQLNRFRARDVEFAETPGVIWIHYPRLVDGRVGSLEQLLARIRGKLTANQAGRFDYLAGVVVSQVLLFHGSDGRIHPRWRLAAAENWNCKARITDPIPYVSDAWWTQPRVGAPLEVLGVCLGIP